MEGTWGGGTRGRTTVGSDHSPWAASAAARPRESRADLGWSLAWPGQHGHLGMSPADIDRGAQLAAVRAHHYRVVPGQPGPGEGLRDARDRGEDNAVQPAIAQRPDDAEEAGVAGGQHHGVAIVGRE